MRQSLAKSPSHVGPGGWQREQIAVVRDDVSCASCDGELNEDCIVRVAWKLETGADRRDVFSDKAKSVQEVFDRRCDVGFAADQFRIVQDFAVFGDNGLAQQR